MFRILMIISIILIMMGFYLKTEEKNNHKFCNSDTGYSSVEKIVELDRRVRALENFKSN